MGGYLSVRDPVRRRRDAIPLIRDWSWPRNLPLSEVRTFSAGAAGRSAEIAMPRWVVVHMAGRLGNVDAELATRMRPEIQNLTPGGAPWSWD